MLNETIHSFVNNFNYKYISKLQYELISLSRLDGETLHGVLCQEDISELSDADGIIVRYIEWLKKVLSEPEFSKYLKKPHINSTLLCCLSHLLFLQRYYLKYCCKHNDKKTELEESLNSGEIMLEIREIVKNIDEVVKKFHKTNIRLYSTKRPDILDFYIQINFILFKHLAIDAEEISRQDNLTPNTSSLYPFQPRQFEIDGIIGDFVTMGKAIFLEHAENDAAKSDDSRSFVKKHFNSDLEKIIQSLDPKERDRLPDSLKAIFGIDSLLISFHERNLEKLKKYVAQYDTTRGMSTLCFSIHVLSILSYYYLLHNDDDLLIDEIDAIYQNFFPFLSSVTDPNSRDNFEWMFLCLGLPSKYKTNSKDKFRDDVKGEIFKRKDTWEKYLVAPADESCEEENNVEEDAVGFTPPPTTSDGKDKFNQLRKESKLPMGERNMLTQRNNNERNALAPLFNDQDIRHDLMTQASGDFWTECEPLNTIQEILTYVNRLKGDENFQHFLLYLSASNKTNRSEIIKSILNDLDIQGSYIITSGNAKGYTMAHIAAALGDVGLLKLCKEFGFNLSQRVDEEGANALDYAIAFGQLASVEFLINIARVEITAVQTPLLDGSVEKLSPLLLSVAKGHLSIVKILFSDERFSSSLMFSNGNILHLAVLSTSCEVLSYLLSQKIISQDSNLLNQENNAGMTPLALAASMGHIIAMELLLKNRLVKKDELNQRSQLAPLHFAIKAAQVDAALLLIRVGCNVNQRCSFVHNGEKKSLTAFGLAEVLKNDSLKKREACTVENEKKHYTRQVNQYTKIMQRINDETSNRRDVQFAPSSVRIRCIKNLVFSGGGVRGLSYVGVIKSLSQLKYPDSNKTFLDEVGRFAGTSAGAITAALLAVGCSAEKLSDEMKSMMPFDRFLEGASLDILDQSPAQKLCTALQSVLRLANPFELHRFLRLLYNFDGISSGNEFLTWIEEKIMNATGITHCTFGELKKLVNRANSEFKDLHIVVTRLSPNPEIVTLSTENPLYDNYIISDAIRASMSVPIAFSPHKLHLKTSSANGDVRIPEPGDCKYVDGGLLSNYPISTFDRAEYKYTGLINFFSQGNQKDFPIVNDETLGFNFTLIDENANGGPLLENTNRIDLLMKIGELYWNAEKICQDHQGNTAHRTVNIKLVKDNFLDLKISEEKIDYYIKTGEATVKNSDYFKCYDDVNLNQSTSSLLLGNNASVMYGSSPHQQQMTNQNIGINVSNTG